MKSRAQSHPTGDVGKGKWLISEGEVIGRWTVQRQDLARRAIEHGRFWFCRCSCGVQKSVAQQSLVNSRKGKKGSKGCGASGCRDTATHRASKTDLYRIWAGMKARCESISNKYFYNYGARGIFVCEKWQDFAAFSKDMSPRPSKEMSIDRIDSNGPYSPENCRWATKKEQQGNRRVNVFLEYNGLRMHLSDWARYLGIGLRCISNRYRRGYSIEDILTVGRLPLKKDRGHGNYAKRERGTTDDKK